MKDSTAVNDESVVRRFLNGKNVLLFWCLHAILINLARLVTHGLSPEAFRHSYSVYYGLFISLVRALVTPAALALQPRFPISGRRWFPHLLVHLVASGLFAVVVAILYLPLHRTFLSDESLSFTDHLIVYNDYYFATESIVYWCITLVYHLLTYLDKYRQGVLAGSRIKEKLTHARLEVLRAQLQPHFLFNTLHTVGALVRLNEKERALNTLEELGALLRHSLDHGGHEFVRLADELAFIKKYLDIEQQRFHDRLRVVYSIEPKAEELLLPTLLLQPLIENAIKHRIGSATDGGRLEVIAHTRDDRLQIEILDDGSGLPHDWTLDRQGGTGLTNTRARLEAIFPGDYSLTLKNRAPRGVSASLSIPLRRASEVAEE